MSAILDRVDGSDVAEELVGGDQGLGDGVDTSFALSLPLNFLDSLFAQYALQRADIEHIGSVVVAPEMATAVAFFIEGNKSEQNRVDLKVEELFNVERAVAALNAHYWDKVLKLSNVLEVMPQKRRNDWYTLIREKKTPDFNENSVKPTLLDLLNSQKTFFAERVDGVFNGLSRTHVTNCPEGFSKRMIFDASDAWGDISMNMCGVVDDLRCVISRFLGRDEPKHGTSHTLITRLRRSESGTWKSIDGNTCRLRVYLKGTVHLEIHPQMSYLLNQMLAHLHPLAIPASFRTKPKKIPKEFGQLLRPLPFAVISMIAEGKIAKGTVEGAAATMTVYPGFDDNKHALQEVARVLTAIGGAQARSKYGVLFHFDYWPGAAIEELVTSGLIPDQRATQCYPTPERVAEAVIEMADIQPGNRCLEPSAGLGDLALRMPADTTCVEVAALRCAVLQDRGLTDVHGADFIKWAADASTAGRTWDRIVMNPPFSEGRWQAHLEAASGLLAAGGRITAVLPVSARSKELLDGWSFKWSEPFDKEFVGTGVSVAIFSAVKP